MGGWVAYRILVSAPVPFGFNWGLIGVGLGLDLVWGDWGLRGWGLGLDKKGRKKFSPKSALQKV